MSWTFIKMVLGFPVRRGEAERIVANLSLYAGRAYTAEQFCSRFLTDLPKPVLDQKIEELNALHRRWQQAKGTTEGTELAHQIHELKRWLKAHDVFLHFHDTLDRYFVDEW
ncbi:hypothetical protein KTH_01050 [Thermosporothrix hazakensis]|nr:hypothetical protein KTC_11000 [Thermosporothrix sp. COM3]GCE45236.1 hypothetical protein KTH_01050 [Thermosporothrix hazakensis]